MLSSPRLMARWQFSAAQGRRTWMAIEADLGATQDKVALVHRA
jgi:hypothetical protein